MDGVALLTITVLAVFVGFEVVSKVSSTLHTPLMSGANAIHGIILVGGFVVTDRMLEMFRGRPSTGSGTRRSLSSSKRARGTVAPASTDPKESGR